MVNLPVYSVRAEEAVLVVSAMDVTTSTLPQIALVAFIVLAFLYVWRKRGLTEASSISSLMRACRRQIVFFAALGLFSVLLVLLATEPLSPIYFWLFNNLPGLLMFREVNKFFLLTVLSVGFFIGLAAEGLKRCMGKCSSIGRNVLPLLLVSLIVSASSWPFLTGDMGGNIGTVEIPEGYREFEGWLSSQKGDFKIAFFPPAVWATTYAWASRWFLDPLVALQVKPTVELKSEFDLTASASLTRWVYTALYSNRTSEWGRLLGVLGVKYLVLKLDADMPPERGDLGAFSLANTLESWGDQGGLQIEKRFGSILVYRNPYQLPHIYQAKGFSLVIGDRRALISLGSMNFD
jgi:hypothetical protein